MIFNWRDDLQVYLYSQAVDMRKQLNGLLMVVSERICDKPQSGTLYLFYNRQRDKVKGVWWDNNGFMLLDKRLEKGRFKLKEIKQDLKLTPQQLSWLLAGLDFIHLNRNTPIPYSEYL